MARTLLQPDQIDIDELISVVVDVLTTSGIGDTYPFQFLPTGAIVPFGGSVAPDKFLLCNGGSHAAATYPGLFAIIGYTYGGAGPNFNVPDLRGRVPAGVGAGSFGSLNDKPGAETHTLTIPQIPAHNHSGATSTDGDHAHTQLWGSTVNVDQENPDATGFVNNSIGYNTNTTTNGSHSHTVATVNTGGGGAHNNIQPSIALNFIIAT